MDRLNVAYIISDQSGIVSEPRNRFLRRGKALFETFYARPIGKYEVRFVNTLMGLVADLAEQSRSSQKLVGNVTILVHGARAPDQPGVFWVNLPLAFESEGPAREDAFTQVNKLLRDSAHYAKYQRDFDYLRNKGLDDQSTVAFLGCLFGRNQQVLDSFREVFGGRATIMAPRHRFMVGEWNNVRGTAELQQIYPNLTREGLLPPGPDSARPGLLQRLAIRLGKVQSPPANVQEQVIGSPSMLERGLVPRGYLQTSMTDDPPDSRIMVDNQDVLTDWGVSTSSTDLDRAMEAYTKPPSPYADKCRSNAERAALREELRRLLLRQRLEEVWPGWGGPVSTTPVAPKRQAEGGWSGRGVLARLGQLLTSTKPLFLAPNAPQAAMVVAPPQWLRACGIGRTPGAAPLKPVVVRPKIFTPPPLPRKLPPTTPTRPGTGNPLAWGPAKKPWPAGWPGDKVTRPPIVPPPRTPRGAGVGGRNPFEWGPGPTKWPSGPGTPRGVGSSAFASIGRSIVPPSSDAIHVVRQGECLSRIARQNGTSVGALAQQNPWLLGRQGRILRGVDYILPGDRIRLSGAPPCSPSFGQRPPFLATLGAGLR